MRKPGVLFLFTLILSFAWLLTSGYWKKANAPGLISTPAETGLPRGVIERMQAKATEAKAFIEKNDFDPGVCFLIDMSLRSGAKRFFVYDLKKDTIKASGLVTHGNCNRYWLEGRKYGNAVGCGCTSLGKYKIGSSYQGKFGLAFKLHGLEQTNDKAFARYVVLHSHSCVPESEIEEEICQSNGCPTVSPVFLHQLKTLIDGSRKPVLLWIYG